MIKSVVSFSLLLVLCCAKRSDQPINFVKETNTITEKQFIDSLHVGSPGKFMLRVSQVRDGEVFVNIELLEKSQKGWLSIQHLQVRKDGVSSLNFRSEDFNEDGYLDFLFQSSIAARGGNEPQALFVYQPRSKTFLRIQNSEDYPNLLLNHDLHCLESWALYAGSTTTFLRISYDSLIPFASVTLLHENLEILEANATGHLELTYSRHAPEVDVYTRFKNYRPLVIRDDN